MTETTWRARLRFRLQKKIRIDGNEHRLAFRTVSLCGQILLKTAAAEIPQADRHVARMYAD